MKKIVIFNVGSASSAYIEIDGVKVMVDIGGGNDFSPVDDFLVPLFEKRKIGKDTEIGKYSFAQLFLTHLDNDHISNFPRFNEIFEPRLLTVPNDHKDIIEYLKIERDKVPDTEIVKEILGNMQERRPGGVSSIEPDYENPLVACDDISGDNCLSLFYNPPQECNKLDEVSDSEYSNYSNNISLVVYLEVNGHSIMFPGDMMNDGMEYLIKNNVKLKNKLTQQGVDFLVAPHHGLDTSFPASLFETIKNNKTKLNIISEKKIRKEETENRHDVDSRYYSEEYAEGVNVVNGVKPDAQYGIITSIGHIVIDLEQEEPTVKRVYDNEELIGEFIR